MTLSTESLMQSLDEAAQVGMTPAKWAQVKPDAIAVHDPDGATHSFGKVNANANRLVRLLRAKGLEPGDAVALVCSNRAEFVETLAATMRSGLRLTPVNWHLTPDEIAYIVQDCDARAIVVDGRVPNIQATAELCSAVDVRLAIGGGIADFDDYEVALAGMDPTDIDDPVLGGAMLYTSGTTGRPKGVQQTGSGIQLSQAMLLGRGYDHETSAQLCAGPGYHAAPLNLDIRTALAAGAPLHFIDKWDSEVVLRTISEQKITHLHMVPIMFQRLLALPPEVRARYPVSSLRSVMHGAAPCPPDVKRAMIEWFGPVIVEYYAGSEGGAGFMISSEEWLQKPGSVGKRPTVLGVRILDDAGQDVPAGVEGTIYHQLPPGGGFRYFKDEAKTAASRVGDYFTMGDVGYFDADDYLFLTGRSAEVIISGGVNIYPQEIDNELIKHPAVADSATVGVPHGEWGEQVKAVILLKPGVSPSDALGQELLEFARARLPGFKAPRSVDFADDLPRNEAGKIQRGKVRAPYWAGRTRQI